MAYQPVNLPKKEVEKINVELKRMNERMSKLEDSVVSVDHVAMETIDDHEKMEDRLDTLQEEVTSLKGQNIELRNHLNSAINELNNIITLLNTRYNDNLLEEVCMD